MPLKFWAHLPFFYPDVNRPFTELLRDSLDIVQAAEDLGFEGVSIPEQQFSNYIVNPSSMQMSALVAGRTKRIKIMTGVIVLPLYQPLGLAGEIALADHIAEGRLSVGVARGGTRYLADRFGVDSSKLRDMYEESLEILIRAWTEDNISGDGRFYSFPETTVLPRPYQQPYPKLWVAAQSETGLRAVGSAGLNVMTSPNLGNFAPHGDLEIALSIYDDAVAKAGVERGQFMVLRHMFIDETEERALKQLDQIHYHWRHYLAPFTYSLESQSDRFSERGEQTNWVSGGKIKPPEQNIIREDIFATYDDPIITGPDKAIERFKYYESIGVDHVTGITAMGMSVGEVIHSMEVMAKSVFPAFAEEPALRS